MTNSDSREREPRGEATLRRACVGVAVGGYVLCAAGSVLLMPAETRVFAVLLAMPLAAMLVAWRVTGHARVRTDKAIWRALVLPTALVATPLLLGPDWLVWGLVGCPVAPTFVVLVYLGTVGGSSGKTLPFRAAQTALYLASLILVAKLTVVGCDLVYDVIRPRTHVARTDRVELGAYGRLHRSDHFTLATNLDLDLVPLAEAAERTLTLAETWFSAEMIPEGPRLPVVLCRDPHEVMARERSLELPYAGDPRRRNWRIAGGYYSDVPMIAFNVIEGGPQRTLCHEVVHYAVTTRAPACPDAIEEGLAMLLSDASMQGRDPARETARREQRTAVCLVLLHDDAIPSLKTFFEYGYHEFRAPRDGRNYVLSLCLVKALEKDYGPRFRESVLSLTDGRDLWSRFAAAFPPKKVEFSWWMEVRAFAFAKR